MIAAVAVCLLPPPLLDCGSRIESSDTSALAEQSIILHSIGDVAPGAQGPTKTLASTEVTGANSTVFDILMLAKFVMLSCCCCLREYEESRRQITLIPVISTMNKTKLTAAGQLSHWALVRALRSQKEGNVSQPMARVWCNGKTTTGIMMRGVGLLIVLREAQQQQQKKSYGL
jgi:hypothetical protein